MRAEGCGVYLVVVVPREAALGEVPQDLVTVLIHSGEMYMCKGGSSSSVDLLDLLLR